MVRKSVTIREDQAKFIDHRHIRLSTWVEDKIETWRDDDGKEFPRGRNQREASMTRKSITISDDLDDWLYEERVNLSHFIQDRLDDRMELERKLDELDVDE